MAFGFRLNCEVMFYREAQRCYDKVNALKDLFGHDDILYTQPAILYAIKALVFSALAVEASTNLLLMKAGVSKRKIPQNISEKIDLLEGKLTGKFDENYKADILDLFKRRNNFVHYKEVYTFSGDDPAVLKRISVNQICRFRDATDYFINKAFSDLSVINNPVLPESEEMENQLEYGYGEKRSCQKSAVYALRHPVWYVTKRLPDKYLSWKILHNFEKSKDVLCLLFLFIQKCTEIIFCCFSCFSCVRKRIFTRTGLIIKKSIRFIRDVFGRLISYINQVCAEFILQAALTVLVCLIAWVPLNSLLTEIFLSDIFSLISCNGEIIATMCFCIFVIIILSKISLIRNLLNGCNAVLISLYVAFKVNFFSLEGVHIETFFCGGNVIDYALLAIVIPAISYDILDLFYMLKSRFSSKHDSKKNHSAPIETEAEDRFRFFNDARKLVDSILYEKKRYSKNSYVIGLRAPWGSGKSSYLNMVKDTAGSKADVIEFRPWHFNSYEGMCRDLYSSISKVLGFDINLRFLLNKYVDLLLSFHIGKVKKLWNFFVSSSSEAEAGIMNLHDRINRKLQRKDKPIIVLVDDLDRLNRDEIFNVFKLIRNNTDFANIVFIVTYDLDYVNVILGNDGLDVERYLEKIFNCPFTLPVVEYADKIDAIIEKMFEIISFDVAAPEQDIANKQIRLSIKNFLNGIRGNITVRNAIRVANSVAYNSRATRDADGEFIIDLSDYLIISYFSIWIPKVYQDLESFATLESLAMAAYEGSVLLHVRQGSEIELRSKDKSFNAEHDYEYTRKKLSELEVKDKDIELVEFLLKMLFKSGRDVYCISNYDYYSTYFERVKPVGIITRKEFNRGWALAKVNDNPFKQWFQDYNIPHLKRLIQEINHVEISEYSKDFELMLTMIPDGIMPIDKSINTYDFFACIPGESVFLEAMKSSHLHPFMEEGFNFVYQRAILYLNLMLKKIKSSPINKRFILLRYYEPLQSVLLDLWGIFPGAELVDGKNISPKDIYPYKYVDMEKQYFLCLEMYLSETSTYKNFNFQYWNSYAKRYAERARASDEYNKCTFRAREILFSHVINHLEDFIDNVDAFELLKYWSQFVLGNETRSPNILDLMEQCLFAYSGEIREKICNYIAELKKPKELQEVVCKLPESC